MTADLHDGFEHAVGSQVEFLYRVAVALMGDAGGAEDVVVRTLRDEARSWDGTVPDRGLLLGALYRRVSESGATTGEGGLGLGVLPQAYRDVVILAALPDVRSADVAVALGVSIETVRTRRRRAFALLFRKRSDVRKEQH